MVKDKSTTTKKVTAKKPAVGGKKKSASKSDYNKYVKKETARIKRENPDLPAKDRTAEVREGWKAEKELPEDQRMNLDSDSGEEEGVASE